MPDWLFWPWLVIDLALSVAALTLGVVNYRRR